MPGPSGELTRLLDEIREGRSVVLVIPETVDADWRALIEDNDADAPWETERRCLAESSAPALALAAEFLSEPVETDALAIRQLADADEFAGLRILVDDCRTDAWPAWGKFLADWSRLTKAITRHRRTVFCIVVRGLSPSNIPEFDDGVSVRFWCGIASSADLMMYATQVFEDAPYGSLERSVAAAVTASVAQWDPRVVEYLRTEPLTDILQPLESLRRLAMELSWNVAEIREKGIRWSAGQCDARDEIAREHAAIHAVLNNEQAIKRLVWSGQLSILLPFVEERRVEYLAMLGRALRSVCDSNNRMVRAEDLEIGQIEYHVRANKLPLAPQLDAALGPLKDIRNLLAHLECVPYELVTHPAVTRLASPWMSRPADDPGWDLPRGR